MLEVAPTGGANQWKTLKTTVKPVTGVHNIFFMFKEGGQDSFRMDYWQFTQREIEPEVIPLESVSITAGAASVVVNRSRTQSTTGKRLVILRLWVTAIKKR